MDMTWMNQYVEERERESYMLLSEVNKSCWRCWPVRLEYRRCAPA